MLSFHHVASAPFFTNFLFSLAQDFQACEAAVGPIEGTPDTVGLGLRLCDSAQADLPYMADLLAATPQMSTFVDALFRANVTNIAVVAGQVTVFAPRNEAMKAYEAASPEELAKLAYDSIVSGRFSKIELAQMVSFRTVGQARVNVTRPSQGRRERGVLWVDSG